MKLNYTFENPELLKTALTHSSYANEHRDKGVKNNERLEFLGDSVLGLICARYIWENYKDMPEGELTKLRAAIVCEGSLYEKREGITDGYVTTYGGVRVGICGQARYDSGRLVGISNVTSLIFRIPTEPFFDADGLFEAWRM
jgi:hypothetical protein